MKPEGEGTVTVVFKIRFVNTKTEKVPLHSLKMYSLLLRT